MRGESHGLPKPVNAAEACSMKGGKTAKLVEELNEHVAGWDLATPGAERTVIRIGYMGDRAKNRGLEDAIRMLRAKYPGVEIVEVKIEPGVRSGDRPLDAFHAALASTCNSDTPCCDRRDEYNGFASGPSIFTCPKRCTCHD